MSIEKIDEYFLILFLLAFSQFHLVVILYIMTLPEWFDKLIELCKQIIQLMFEFIIHILSQPLVLIPSILIFIGSYF